jgi:hypothetical protein
MLHVLAVVDVGIRTATPQMVWRTLLGLGSIFVLVFLFWVVRRLVERHRLRRSNWDTFQSIPLETRTLTVLLNKARLKRPTQALGSIQLFDRCVEQVLSRGGLTEAQQAILEAVRRKLLATAVRWDGRDRRNLERARCSLPAEICFVTREAVDDELKGSVGETDPRFVETLNSLLAAAPAVKAEVTEVSAGGMAVLTNRLAPAREGDFGVVQGDPARLGVDLSRLVGQVVACTDHPAPGKGVFHLSFLPYPVERRRDIIRFVYKSAASPAPAAPARPAAPPPSASPPGGAPGTAPPAATP